MKIERILKDLGIGFMHLDRGFVFGSQGQLFRRNLEQLWFQSCVVMPPYNVFLSSTDRTTETLSHVENSGADNRPLGLAVLEESKSLWNSDIQEKLNSHKIGRVTVITDALEGKDLYHKKQRERKVWWRKFAREPSRFKFTEAKKTKSKDSIEIEAHFPFGSIVVETITHLQDARKIFPQNDPTRPDVQVVEHTASLDWGCLAFLCDAYSSSENSCQLKLHPKLSPYKVGFHIEQSENADPKLLEKSRLLLYLNNMLKTKGIETVVTTSFKGIENFRVPLVVTVDDSSIHNGIVKVWNHLTTLAESVHVTDLSKYIISRCS